MAKLQAEGEAGWIEGTAQNVVGSIKDAIKGNWRAAHTGRQRCIPGASEP